MICQSLITAAILGAGSFVAAAPVVVEERAAQVPGVALPGLPATSGIPGTLSTTPANGLPLNALPLSGLGAGLPIGVPTGLAGVTPSKLNSTALPLSTSIVPTVLAVTVLPSLPAQPAVPTVPGGVPVSPTAISALVNSILSTLFGILNSVLGASIPGVTSVPGLPSLPSLPGLPVQLPGAPTLKARALFFPGLSGSPVVGTLAGGLSSDATGGITGGISSGALAGLSAGLPIVGGGASPVSSLANSIAPGGAGPSNAVSGVLGGASTLTTNTSILGGTNPTNTVETALTGSASPPTGPLSTAQNLAGSLPIVGSAINGALNVGNSHNGGLNGPNIGGLAANIPVVGGTAQTFPLIGSGAAGLPGVGTIVPSVAGTVVPVTDTLKNGPINSIAGTAQGAVGTAAGTVPSLPLGNVPGVAQVAPVVAGVVGTALNTAASAPLNTIEGVVPGGAAPFSPILATADPAFATFIAVLAAILHIMGLEKTGILGPIARLMARGDANLEELLKRDMLNLASLEPRQLPVDPSSLPSALPVVNVISTVSGAAGGASNPVGTATAALSGITSTGLPIIAGGGLSGISALNPSIFTGLLGGLLGNIPGLSDLGSLTSVVSSLLGTVSGAIGTITDTLENSVPGLNNVGPIAALMQTLPSIDATKYSDLGSLNNVDAIKSTIGELSADKLTALSSLPTLPTGAAPLTVLMGLLNLGDKFPALGVTMKEGMAFELAKTFGIPLPSFPV